MSKLCNLIVEQKHLERAAKDLTKQRRWNRECIAAEVAKMAAREDKRLDGNQSHNCGCIVVRGQLWRDCANTVLKPSDRGRVAYPYERDANEAARASGKKPPYPQFDADGKLIPGHKAPCSRKKPASV